MPTLSCRAAVSAAIVALLTASASAQKLPGKSKTRPANVVHGTLAAIDIAAATVTVKPKSGPEAAYRITERTLVWRAKKLAEPSVFKSGDDVVVRFRKSSVGPSTLYDLADTASWAWLDHLRHDTAQAAVREVDEKDLRVVEGPDAAEFAYRVTEKTQWSKGGKPAAPSDFKAGDSVSIVPRLLPGGGTMAIAVTDNPADAARLKERGRLTLSGTVRSIDAQKRTVAIHTAAGDDRELSMPPDCIVRSAGKDVPVSYLRAGQSVTLHLTRVDAGDPTVKQVTIKGKTTTKLVKPGTPKKP